MKKCEICGKELHESDFSKSYKNRCKKCVAEMTKAKRKKAPTLKDLHEIESICGTVALYSIVDSVRNVADALREFADKIIYELEKKGEKNG